MNVTVNGHTIELVRGDITRQDTDAIVNAANRSLLGGGGVDGAIHRAGGPAILRECRTLGGCETGDARITGGGRLKARYVIHAVGPVWRGGGRDDERLLRSAYRNSLLRARDAGAASVSFPSISTGAYSYPVHLAARAALDEVIAFCGTHETPATVRFVLFDRATFSAYERALHELTGKETE